MDAWISLVESVYWKVATDKPRWLWRKNQEQDSFCEILLFGKKGQILEKKDILQRFNVDYANKVFFLQPQILSDRPSGSVLFLNF